MREKQAYSSIIILEARLILWWKYWNILLLWWG